MAVFADSALIGAACGVCAASLRRRRRRDSPGFLAGDLCAARPTDRARECLLLDARHTPDTAELRNGGGSKASPYILLLAS